MSNYAAYQNRTVDVSLLGAPAGESQALRPSPAPGLVLTGILKLCQQFIYRLLTTKGSILGMPEVGSDFVPLLRSGKLRTDYDIQAAFSTSAADIQAQLELDVTEQTPLDEQLESVQVQQVTIEPFTRSISLTVLVNSLAGGSRAVVLPITNLLGG